MQVERGTVGAKVQFDIEAGGDQHIQVLTREGVHVAGTAALTNAQANNLMSFDSGFGTGGYSNTYLNKVGSAAYLDTAIEFGVRATEQQVKQRSVDPDTGILTETTVTEPAIFSSKPVSATSNSSGSTQTLVAANAINFNHTYYDPADSNADTDGYVKGSIALGALTQANSTTVSAASMAEYFNGEFERLSNVNVTATAQNTVLAGEIDSSKTLTINGISIAHSATAKVDDLIKAINDKSGQTLVRAEWRGSEGLALTNTAGSEGANITIGVTGSDKISAIGLAPGTYAGTYSIAATGEERLSNAFTTKTQALNAGSGFTLAITRGGNPAQNVTIAAAVTRRGYCCGDQWSNSHQREGHAGRGRSQLSHRSE